MLLANRLHQSLLFLFIATTGLLGPAMCLEGTAVTEPGYYPCGKPQARDCMDRYNSDDTVEARKAYVERLKKHRAITDARDAITCTSLKALESQTPINKFRHPDAAAAWAKDCAELLSGQIVELKECSPSFHSCQFVEKETSKEFWTDLYNVSPEL